MNHSTPRLRLAFRIACSFCTLVVPVSLASSSELARGDRLTSREARDTPQRLEVKTHLTESGPIETLVLERFEVFAPDVTIALHAPDGVHFVEPPANSYFRGHVGGRIASRVYLVHLEDGTIRGVVEEGDRHWVLGGDAFAKAGEWRVEGREVEPVVELNHDAAGFVCETDLLREPPVDRATASSTEVAKPSAVKSAAYTARIAIETDNEFFNKFGNATDATNYVADIIAYGSMIYSAELSTSWLLQHLALWPPATPDPWSQSSPDCGLYEFGRYWNDNRQTVSRTTAAFLSGKSTNAGIAWVGVLCYGAFNVDLGTSCSGLTPSIDNYGGAYAYVGGIDGNFDIDNPAVLWDIVAVTHEIGHNFNSPHTHCYANLGGNNNPIDKCYSGECGRTGCNCESASLPAGCPGGGSGCGTIMSYCHQLYPYMSNLSLTLGLNHPYGIEPERVPERMFSHVTSRASSSPGCLAYTVTDMIFEDDFETHDTDAWSSTVP